MQPELKARWAQCVREASMRLLNIVIEHDSSQLEHLSGEERKFVSQGYLTASEMRLLEEFVEKKQREIILKNRKSYLGTE